MKSTVNGHEKSHMLQGRYLLQSFLYRLVLKFLILLALLLLEFATKAHIVVKNRTRNSHDYTVNGHEKSHMLQGRYSLQSFFIQVSV